MKPAIYLHGEPQNLEAAATDALEWLKILQSYMAQWSSRTKGMQTDNQRIAAAIAALEMFLPNTTPMHQEQHESWPFEVVNDAVTP